MNINRFTIKRKADLIRAINEFGFLPFFENSIEGFSIEEHIAPNLWFTEEEGPWEWKGPVIRETGCAYGKFFEKKACFISAEWFPDFANYRRDGYDFDALYDDGLAPLRDKELYDLLDGSAPILSRQLKEAGNYRKGGNKGFDTVISRLQSRCYVVISDFVYMEDRYGQPYGWGVAQYSTPEKHMGAGFTDKVYQCAPEESYDRLLSHFIKLFPKADVNKIKRFLG